ncbi:hypothetical protein [Brachyspira aalborgi]|uniref:Uncharacterized protein n=1 Tax=Brachyspira aalborgi TaxID=29522 RepID=A0A5C8FMA9_9SPIR|nr:hypothetical protein [Brachyspira aalborgi]TXJ50604.1 hypothetical protein EPJ84_06025 [Brachyspira aalborgi]
MTILKNKNLRKSMKKLIFIISILMITALNLFGEVTESIEFTYYYYTNKIYHSTLKTEIIPSEYVFITTGSYSNYYYYSYEHTNLYYSYLYNLKTKEKKLFHIYKYLDNEQYYDINGNLTTNWTDTNMEANKFYKITNNRFGETFYNQIYHDNYSHNIKTIGITKWNGYIQKAYKYSLTQPEIINKKDRGIYLFKGQYYGDSKLFYTLCFQNEYYTNGYSESELLNYTNGRVLVQKYNMPMQHSYSIYDGWRKQWITYNSGGGNDVTNIFYFQLNNKSLIKPTWNELTNDFLNYRKLRQKEDKVYYIKEDIEKNLRNYNAMTDNIKYLGFIPIEEFEYYLLAD